MDAEFQQILVDYMGWEKDDLRLPPVQNVDVAGGESLMFDREVREDIRAVFHEGRWTPRQR